MAYKVLAMFTDLQDSEHKYEEGDIYPREGYEPSQERIDELASISNKRGMALIEKIEVQKKAAKKEEPKEEPIEEPKEEPKAQPKKKTRK